MTNEAALLRQRLRSPLPIYAAFVLVVVADVGCDAENEGEGGTGMMGTGSGSSSPSDTGPVETSPSASSEVTAGSDVGTTTGGTSAAEAGTETDSTGSSETTTGGDTGSEHEPDLRPQVPGSCDQWLAPLPNIDEAQLIAELENSSWAYTEGSAWFFGRYGETEWFEYVEIWTAWAVDHGRLITEYWSPPRTAGEISYARHIDTATVIGDHLAHTGYCQEIIFTRIDGPSPGEDGTDLQGRWRSLSAAEFTDISKGQLRYQLVRTELAELEIVGALATYSGVSCSTERFYDAPPYEFLEQDTAQATVRVSNDSVEIVGEQLGLTLTRIDDHTLRLISVEKSLVPGLPGGIKLDSCTLGDYARRAQVAPLGGQAVHDRVERNTNTGSPP